MRTRYRFSLGLLLAVAGGIAGLIWWRGHGVGDVQRGARLAAANGCLGCHGPSGRLADPDGTRMIGPVPSFDHDDVTAYAKSADDIREWILDGQPRRLREEKTEEPPPALRMPAWRGRFDDQEVDALVAYVRAVSAFDPIPVGPAAGYDTAASLGCFSCHGPQGRGDTPNAGSLKGYIPSWGGTDFPELVRGDGEIREWVRDGAPRRLREHPVASFFIRRQAIRMPAYGTRVTEAEIAQIVGYIRWLRSPAGVASAAAAR
jgi:mono/diheme cytochrome c family protein